MMRTVTSNQKILYKGQIHERTVTHIVTGAHGYETLCTSGCMTEHDDEGNVIEHSVFIEYDDLPVTCSTCYTIWKDTKDFKETNFSVGSGQDKFFVDENLNLINSLNSDL